MRAAGGLRRQFQPHTPLAEFRKALTSSPPLLPQVRTQPPPLSLPKTPAGHTRAPFRSIDACQGQRVNRPSLLHRNMTGIENESRPDGSSPRRARPMDEKACFCLKKSVPARRARRARYGVTKRLSGAPFVSMVQARMVKKRIHK